MANVRILVSLNSQGKIECEVKDYLNRNGSGSINLHISGITPDIIQPIDNLTNQWQIIQFNTVNNTGNYYKVSAILSVGSEVDEDEQIFKL